MIKYIIYGLIVIVAIAAVLGGVHLIRVNIRNKKEMAPFINADAQAKNNLGKVLVVYYSLSGKTKDIAQRIQAQTGADMFEIKTSSPLPSGAALHLQVKKQLESGIYSEIEGPLPDFAAYDAIFIGAPVWWYRAATPFLAFLNEADFKGKKVIAFSTQGSNQGAFLEDVTNNAKNAVLLTPEKFNNMPEKYDKAVDNKIAVWISGLE